LFFKKGLRDSSLIYKLAMRNPRISEEMLVIANKYALVEEATLDTREQKKEKESGHSNQPSSSKGCARRGRQISLSTTWSSHDVIRSTSPGWMNSKASWIRFAFFIHKESTRPRTVTDSKVS
jgi:hypothetical protein